MSIFAGTDLYKEPTCDRCGKIEDECVCEPVPAEAKPPEKQTARLSVEKRKRGKMVTVIRGLAEGHPAPHFANLLTAIKNHVGACLLYTSPSPRDATLSRMPSSA